MANLNQTTSKIVSFAYLPNGWNFGRGVAAKEAAVRGALTLLCTLDVLGFHDTGAYPGDDGSVMLSAYVIPDHYYDFDVNPSGQVTVTHARCDQDEELFYQEGMSVGDAQSKIKEFALQRWDTSDFLTSVTTIVRNISGSRVTLSETSATAQVYQSSISTVPSEHLEVYVPTAPSSTPPSQERRSSTGRSLRKSFETIGI